MAEREPIKEKHLAAIREIDSSLADRLESHSRKTIAQAHDILKQMLIKEKSYKTVTPEGHKIYNITARYVAEAMRKALEEKTLDKENLPKLVSLLHKSMIAGYDAYPLANAVSEGLEHGAFNKENIAEILQALNQTPQYNPRALAMVLSEGLRNEVLNNENLTQMIKLLQQTMQKTAAAGYDSEDIAITLATGFRTEAFNNENLPQILLALQKTATAGYEPDHLGLKLRVGIKNGLFKTENLPKVVELASRYAEKGKDPFVLATALQTPHLPATPENLKALEEAEPHILRAHDFLHGIQAMEDHEKVSAPLFAYILKTHKTLLPKIGEKDYWQHIKVYASQLKAGENIK